MSNLKTYTNKIKIIGKDKIPVRFVEQLRTFSEKARKDINYIEEMYLLIINHPFFPWSYNSDLFDFRKELSYEIIYRLNGYIKSFIANANLFNQIGTGISIRCISELYAFSKYIIEKECNNEKLLEKLIHGRMFFSGDWFDLEEIWLKKHDSDLPDDFKTFTKQLLKIPSPGTYLNYVKNHDKDFEYIYALFSEYIHPIFARPRSHLLEDAGITKDNDNLFELEKYFEYIQNNEAPCKTIISDNLLLAILIGKIWPLVLNIDPFYDENSHQKILEILENKIEKGSNK